MSEGGGGRTEVRVSGVGVRFLGVSMDLGAGQAAGVPLPDSALSGSESGGAPPPVDLPCADPSVEDLLSGWVEPPAELPLEQVSAEWAQFVDALEESLVEAAACGDVGFYDRVFVCRERPRDPDTVDGVDAADELPPECWHGLDPESGEEPEVAPEPDWRLSDPARVEGPVAWLQLALRGKNQADARFLAALHQVGHHDVNYDAEGFPARDQYACQEIGAAIRHSEQAAGGWLSLAEAMIERLPKLYEAVADGWLDLDKARSLVTATRDMPIEVARWAVATVLPAAADLARRQLAEKVQTAAFEIDPDWMSRREQAARGRLRVEYRRNPAGTGDVALRDLGAEQVVVIKARTDVLARQLRLAAASAGLPLGKPALRGLVSQRLLDGSYTGPGLGVSGDPCKHRGGIMIDCGWCCGREGRLGE